MQIAKVFSTTIISLILSMVGAQSQPDHLVTDNDISVDSGGSILIHEDARISQLVTDYDAYTKKEPQYEGYRIEIFSSSGENSKLKAKNVRLRFLSKFPEDQAYLCWEYPNFEVRVGNYRNRLEAEKALQHIQEDFPFAFVKKDRIDPPDLESDELPEKTPEH